MGPVNWLAVVLATLAFYFVGGIWYGMLFRRAWQQEASVSGPPQGSGVLRVMLGTIICEFIVVSMLGHLFARTAPSPQAMMMMATGFGLMVMSPAIGINYLHQKRSLKLFLIDAGHFTIGMAVVGAVFVALA